MKGQLGVESSASVSCRLTKKHKSAFVKKSRPYGGVSEVLRELAIAFIEDRLTIAPPTNRKELYTNE